MQPETRYVCPRRLEAGATYGGVADATRSFFAGGVRSVFSCESVMRPQSSQSCRLFPGRVTISVWFAIVRSMSA